MSRVAYLPTDRNHGVLSEVLSGAPGAELEPDETQALSSRIVFEGTPAGPAADRSTLTGEHLAAYAGA